MVKVLLVYEDFNDLTLTESYLKRVGFDVVGISNEILIQDQILSFNPDVIVANGRNPKVSSFSVGQKMKENQRYQGKVVIVVPKDVRPSPQDILRIRMDGIIETPVNPEKLIQVLCRLTNQSPTIYMDKFQKARLSDPELKRLIMVTSTQPATPNVSPLSNSGVAIDDPQRMSKYKKFTEGVNFDLKASTHQRQDLKEKQKDLKKNWNFDELEEQDRLRQQFAEALFKKK
jgi:DNA-binding NarL/FixJ family response regulator